MNDEHHLSEAELSSPVSSALVQLDAGMLALLAQLDCLRACLEFDEEYLHETFHNAYQQSTALCDLIRAERPDANWDDRQALERLIQQLEAAALAKRNHQRRSRLVELANELDAGAIKHRLESRTTALNALRQQAVKELRSEAVFSEQIKELPGPNAGLWLRWACNLDDDKDVLVLEALRKDFPALERFTGAMDESYWVPGRGAREEPAAELPIRPAKATETAPPAAGPSTPATPARTTQAKPSDVRQQVVQAIDQGNYSEALSLCYEPGSSDATSKSAAPPQPESIPAAEPPALPEVAPAPPAAAAPASRKAAEAASGKKRRESGGKWRKVGEPGTANASAAKAQTVPAAQSRNARSGEATKLEPAKEVAVAKAIKPSNGDSVPVAAAAQPETAKEEVVESPASVAVDEPFPTLVEAGAHKKPVIAWAGGAFVVLSLIIFLSIYHFRGNSSSRPGETVAAASPNPAASPAAGDTGASGQNALTPGALLHRQPAEGAQQKIVLSVEHCGRGSGGDVQCWGYVSNLGNEDASVTLDRVDVVDGKGNSFSVDRRGQFVFDSGHTTSIPVGSHAKYTVSVPDKDKDAKTLTLYMDLSNPRGLEYTFRDIPVVE